MRNFEPTTDRRECALRELLQCGLWGRTPRADVFELLSNADWQALLELAERQAVTGLCYPPVLKLSERCGPPEQVLIQWYARAGYIEQFNCRLRRVWTELNEGFKRAGLKVILLKGIGVADWYEKPLLRAPGDIDLYFPADYDRAVETVKSWGIEVKGGDWHDTFHYKGVEVELHAAYHHLSSPGLDIATQKVGEGPSGYLVPAAAYNARLLVVHPAFHLLKEGIGIRYLCDWAVFLKAHSNTIDFDCLEKDLRQLGTGDFCRVFTALTIAYVELDGVDLPSKWTTGIPEKKLIQLYNDMMATGNFGRNQMMKKPFAALSLVDKLRLVRKEVFRAAALSPYCRKQARRFICHKLGRVLRAVLTGKEFGRKQMVR